MGSQDIANKIEYNIYIDYKTIVSVVASLLYTLYRCRSSEAFLSPQNRCLLDMGQHPVPIRDIYMHLESPQYIAI
jgi:hypothetical protein